MHLPGLNVVRKYWLQEGKLTLFVLSTIILTRKSYKLYIKAAGIKFQHKAIHKC